MQDELREHSEQLFGIERPLAKSALGPYDGADNLQAIQVARGLRVSLLSSSVASAADQMARHSASSRSKAWRFCLTARPSWAMNCARAAATPAARSTSSCPTSRGAAVRLAVQGLVERDRPLIERVISGDEPLNRLHIEIDGRCFTLLALYQPMAADLRTVVAAVKINADLERIGDHATNVAEDVIFIVSAKDVRHHGVQERPSV